MFFDIPEGSKLILAGNGVTLDEYREFIDTYYLYYEITAIADTKVYEKKEYLRGLDIVPYEEWELKDGILVLFGKTWFKDGEDLHQCGYTLIRDFIPAWFFKVGFKENLISLKKLQENMNDGVPEQYFRYIAYSKKIAVTYGDGNIPKINRVLSRTKKFCNDYVIISLPPVQSIAKKQAFVCEEIWKYISLFFVQSIKQNSLISEEYTVDAVKSKLRRNCKVITFPVLSFWGYFPQAVVNKSALKTINGELSVVMFPYADKYIEEKISKGMDIENIVEILEDNSNYLCENIQRFCEEKILDIEELEQNSDIKYSKWLRENYKKHKLFLNPSLPSYALIKYIVTELLNKLGYHKDVINERDLVLNEYGEMPIYNMVAKALSLSFDASRVKWIDNTDIDYSGYVKEYVDEYRRK